MFNLPTFQLFDIQTMSPILVRDLMTVGVPACNIKRLLVILLTFFLVGCASTATPIPNPPVKAIYLVQGDGQLSAEDLKAYPEVVVTNSFDDFKKLTRTKTALWIDINAVGTVDSNWLNEDPQKFYPVVLIGNGDALCTFRDTLNVFGISGPYADCSSPPPGFSVGMLRYATDEGTSAFMKGYEQTPTCQGILDITNALLDGELR